MGTQNLLEITRKLNSKFMKELEDVGTQIFDKYYWKPAKLLKKIITIFVILISIGMAMSLRMIFSTSGVMPNSLVPIAWK